MAIDIRSSRALAVSAVEILLQELIAKHAAQVDGHFSATAQIPKTLAAMLSVAPIHSEEHFEDIIREILTMSPNLLCLSIAFEPNEFLEGVERFAPSIYRVYPGSNVLISENLASINENYDYTQRDWYRIVKETGQASWSEPYLDYTTQVPMCTYSVPFIRDGRFIGVVMIDVGLDYIQETVTRTSPEGAKYRLLSATGRFIAAAEPELVMKETIFSIAEKTGHDHLIEIGNSILQDDEGIVLYNGIFNNRRAYLTYAPLPITDWHLTVSIPTEQVLAPVYASVYRRVIHFLVAFVVIFFVIIIVARRLTMPIQHLAAFAKELAAGNLDAQVGDVRLAREVDQLANTFDTMVVNLKSNIEHRLVVEGELKAARKIQASLIPRSFPPFPERKEFELHATNEPVAFIAGDFFDFFFIKPDTLAFVIADVSGHGTPAALFMAVSRTAIRTFAIADQSPREIINRVNQVLSADNDNVMFVTVFYGHYNVNTGELTYVNAGHDPPYIVRGDGSLEALPATGPLVAAFEDISYEEQTVNLEPGDLLVAYTDGVTEAHSSRDNIMYGTERLEQLIREVRDESVVNICNRIQRATDDFAKYESYDDVTLLVLRRN